MRQLGTPALLAATYRGDAAAIAAAAMEELETVLVDSLSQLERLAVSAGAAPSPSALEGAPCVRRCTQSTNRQGTDAWCAAMGAAEKADTARADWAQVYLSVLPTLPLCAPGDEARVTASLRAACAKARTEALLPGSGACAPQVLV